MHFTTTNGKKLKIVFHYPHKLSKKRKTVITRIVFAKKGEDGTRMEMVEGEGRSECNLDAGDKFSIPSGRMISLKRALENGKFERLDRIKAYRAFYERGVKG